MSITCISRLHISVKNGCYIGLNVVVFGFRAKCHPNPASDFLGFRRKTNSYVGKPILTSDFVGFFFRFFSVVLCFFCHILEFSKRFGFYMCFFVFLGFVGVKVHYIFVFFFFFLVLAIYFFLVWAMFFLTNDFFFGFSFFYFDSFTFGFWSQS